MSASPPETGESKVSELERARFVLGVATPDESDVLIGLLETGDVPIRLPDASQAAWTVLEAHIGAIAHGELEPELGLQLVINEVFRNPELAGSRSRSMGESHDAARLVALQDQYDDIRRQRRAGGLGLQASQVSAQVVLEAREWMRRNATGRL